MQKKPFQLVLSAALLVTLSACGSGTTKPSSSSTATTAPATSPQASTATAAATGPKTKLTYWTNDRGASDHIKAEVAKYNAENKDNIEVEVTIMADNYEQSLDVAFASNQAPDIIKMSGSNFAPFVKKGYLEPLDSFMTPDFKKRFTNLIIDDGNKVDGKVYSLPNYGITWRLIYNVDLFQKAGIAAPPKTLNEMVEVAKKLTVAGKDIGAYGFAGNFKNNGGFSRTADPIVALSTGNLSGFNFKTGKFDFSSHIPMLEALRKMKTDGSMIPGFELLDIDPLRAQFAEGKIGMYINHASEPGVYKNQFPAKIKWSAAPVPTIDGTINGAAQFSNATVWLGISAKSANKAKAWKFLENMYSPDVLKTYQEDSVGISAVPDVIAVAKKPSFPNMDLFIPNKYDALYPVVPAVTPEGKNVGDEALRYILEGGDVNKITADLAARYNAALDKARQAGSTTNKPMPDFDAKNLQGTMAK
ncbi:ABC transporter substrate-binding protein [Paenibacillus roseipurpureus]|uniref:Sugar ABC transporter substrate-binding protein n=1 Tax=Paenibacillus roseopurpureus TaxID=2918901 RepID=A0AA96LRQ1_9BACL|nr:sugar ABC transporter substrate-binding protein [Paenibacillus sp. MBLB1832]WNR45341.1 sugar ABC transporter substrate-binding protein [Paenibacillus sp. MBLB1832]